jgi:hypothetical protein
MKNLKYLLIVGPGLYGDENFDEACVFGNHVEMNYNQVLHLTNEVITNQTPAIKHYICTMTKSFVTRDICKMVSLSEFS